MDCAKAESTAAGAVPSASLAVMITAVLRFALITDIQF
jgi:hypothetical protein